MELAAFGGVLPPAGLGYASTRLAGSWLPGGETEEAAMMGEAEMAELVAQTSEITRALTASTTATARVAGAVASTERLVLGAAAHASRLGDLGEAAHGVARDATRLAAWAARDMPGSSLAGELHRMASDAEILFGSLAAEIACLRAAGGETALAVRRLANAAADLGGNAECILGMVAAQTDRIARLGAASDSEAEHVVERESAIRIHQPMVAE